MRPGDHPDFFRLPPPEGRSRESTIRIDRLGRFFHDGQEVEHAKLAKALASWISRHPDNGRYILTNGYDWTYFEVEDVPFFIRSVRDARATGRGFLAELNDGSEEELQPEELEILDDGGVRTKVKRGAPGGPYDAKFARAALVDLGEYLDQSPDGALTLGGRILGENRASRL
jgi:hypothetical protein